MGQDAARLKNGSIPTPKLIRKRKLQENLMEGSYHQLSSMVIDIVMK